MHWYEDLRQAAQQERMRQESGDGDGGMVGLWMLLDDIEFTMKSEFLARMQLNAMAIFLKPSSVLMAKPC